MSHEFQIEYLYIPVYVYLQIQDAMWYRPILFAALIWVIFCIICPHITNVFAPTCLACK